MPIRIRLKYNCLNNVCYDDKAMLFSLVVCIDLKILYNAKGIQGIMFRDEF
ncbi:hypothetical protein OTSUT76_2843 [Orientia tsutsugamushi str. UT76]|nr:hypothetical protein OTSUT76_2843 [Orientia tsutsugamushi str. UT76]